jgi:hypothetical protein
MNEEPTEQRRDHRAIPFHPVLFAVAPILFVYAYNAAKIRIEPGELLLPIALSLLVTAVLWTALGVLLRSVTRAAYVVSLCLVLFFSYGHVAEALGPEGRVWADLLLLCALFLAAGIWLVVRRSRPAIGGSQSGITVLLNSVAAAILLLNLVTGMRAFTLRRPPVERDLERAIAATKEYPDIYYIIADSYTSSDVLKSRYHTDNSAFLGELSRLGFFIADRARSNYVMTYLSLASSLNFNYLDSLTGVLGPESDDYGPMIDMIQDSRLVGFLRRRGYTIASFASDISGLDLRNADVRLVPPGALSEFQSVLANTTLLRDVFYLLRMSPNDLHRNLVLFTLRNIPGAGRGRHPVFVWAHILCPHKPFVFDSLGGRPRYSLKIDVRATKRTSSKAQVREWLDTYYGPQVTYLNALLDDAVRRILVQSSRPPIIIIQGDHGPGAELNWGDPEGDEPSVLWERHAILNAVYLPPSGTSHQPSHELYDSITPVNTFRVILSRYFDTTMTLLPDRCYFSTPLNPYQLHDMDRLGSSRVEGRPTK